MLEAASVLMLSACTFPAMSRNVPAGGVTGSGEGSGCGAGVGVGSGVGSGCGVGVGGVASRLVMTPSASTMPAPRSAPAGRAVAVSMSRSAPLVTSWSTDSARPARPATSGADDEVPQNERTPDPSVAAGLQPGAATSIHVP